MLIFVISYGKHVTNAYGWTHSERWGVPRAKMRIIEKMKML